ncbi:hypothetical protein [Puniceicoccus vermicola]|uniref:Uncharacterized protein n=1 Tax=Puniceicoccus vermicola TaxID=388746 RepID=A0A7X1E6L9_9BACT|nr:hypothetical protein [Puniceicoccus vermicola]MBC2604248.1 hypothetical protein [Puniceicoccus vermicola]
MNLHCVGESLQLPPSRLLRSAPRKTFRNRRTAQLKLSGYLPKDRLLQLPMRLSGHPRRTAGISPISSIALKKCRSAEVGNLHCVGESLQLPPIAPAPLGTTEEPSETTGPRS